MSASVRSYTVSAGSVARGVTLLAALALGACSGLRLPWDAARGETELTTGSITPHPASRVRGEALPPLPAAAALGATQARAPEGALGPAAPPASAPSVLAPLVWPAPERAAIEQVLGEARLDEERAATLPWLERGSGRGGLITPVGAVFRVGPGHCRAVVISRQSGAATELAQGTACRLTGPGWTIEALRPFRQPA